MKHTFSIRSFSTYFALACIALFLTGCAQTSLSRDTSGFAIAQPYASAELPIPVLPQKSDLNTIDLWAALAYSDHVAVINDPTTPLLFGIGIATNYATAQEAENAALQICEADQITGCKTRAVFQKQCLVVAYDKINQSLAWSVEYSADKAEKTAENICKQHSPQNACSTFSIICPGLANAQKEIAFAQSNPQDAALLAHNLAAFAQQAARLRDLGVTHEELLQKLGENSPQSSEEDIIIALYQQQVDLVYGPLKAFSPEQIYRSQMFSILYSMY